MLLYALLNGFLPFDDDNTAELYRLIQVYLLILVIYTVTSMCVCLEVSISNVIPESLDICPQLHLKQISQSSGITLLIHTSRHTVLNYLCMHVCMEWRNIKLFLFFRMDAMTSLVG